ncbi:MAG: S8 family serine peptidase [Bacteroidia bacterium]|nr:S8 family serine peptidase [Bacteroidia bacterium]MDW8235924.1 S8 family serine peptidase [Bacteroidia bacterium]
MRYLMLLQVVVAQTHLYHVEFVSKPRTLLLYPETFLSQAAIERRAMQGIPIDETDLPVPQAWIDSLSRYAKVLGVSRWLNAALIESTTPLRLPSWPFIACVASWAAPKYVPPVVEATSSFSVSMTSPTNAINSAQLAQLKLLDLHSAGYTGRGIRVAILDAGFPAMDTMRAFRHIFDERRYIQGYDFVAGDSTIFGDDSHGTLVSSVILGYAPGIVNYMGGAPHISVILARTENAASETRTEEWNWARAAEWSDSLGAHIIQSSLGYSTFDDPTESYTYAQMDGRTAITTQAARIAARKGILVVSSAGNEGNQPWHYITAPADADSILAIGAVNEQGNIAPFSSRGPTADRRVKPDVVAVGWGTYVLNRRSEPIRGSGTSFAAPLITSLAACLWQARPNVPGWIIRNAILLSGDRFQNPDTLYGHGIPDGVKALQRVVSLSYTPPIAQLQIYPNPVSSTLYVSFIDGEYAWYDLQIWDMQGNLLHSQPYRGMVQMPIDINHLPQGLYFLYLRQRDTGRTFQASFVKI